MINLIKIIYDIQTKELTMIDKKDMFKEGENIKYYPVSVIEERNSSFYDPKGIVLYFQYNNYSNRFNEAEDYFYSLNIDFNNLDYLKLQDYRLEIYKE